MNSQQHKGQKVQDDRYSNLEPKEKPGLSPRDPIRNPKLPEDARHLREDGVI